MIDIKQTNLIQQKVEQKKLSEKVEPQLEIQSISQASTPTALNSLVSDIEIDMPDIEFDEQQQQLLSAQKNWTQPSAGTGNSTANSNGTEYIGQRENTNRVVVPASTRRPNIPKIAFDNHVNGWVLLAYTVTTKGKVKNIQVMDAYPRGIFEANAIAAVKTWIYEPFKGEDQYVSQRIEFRWDFYHYNMDLE